MLIPAFQQKGTELLALKERHRVLYLLRSVQAMSPTIAHFEAVSSLFQLAGLMNEEAKGTNVVTTIVVPSTIDTIQNRKSMPDGDVEKWVTPHSIADIIFYHCTEQALVIREPILKVYHKS